MLAAANACDALTVVAVADESPNVHSWLTSASPTSWSVLRLVKVQARSEQDREKFAVGAVFAGVPDPDDLLFISSFAGGEVFRSGVTFTRGRGRIFYFSPGDQEYPVYQQSEIQHVLANGVRWVAPAPGERQVPGVTNPPRQWLL